MTKNNDNPQDPLVFVVADEAPFQRLDKTLAGFLPEHSRSRLQGWIEREHVLLNGQVASVKSTAKPGDILTVWEETPPEANAFSPEPVEFDVIAHSSAWIVVNKPVGLVVHPGAGNWSGTLLNGLLFRYPELAQIPRAGIVHRLDKDTSGLMVVARQLTSQTELVRQLQARTVKRQYIAFVHGHVKQAGVMDDPIGRDPRVPVRMTSKNPVAPKPALTHYEVAQTGYYLGEPVTKVICRLETGRTHQIRVHFSNLGHPLLGDTLYGGKVMGLAVRQMLHAQALHFYDVEASLEQRFESELAMDMLTVFDQWEF